jgi:hypothetical protein
MYEKQGFFKMEISDQNKLRSFMIIFSVVQIITSLFASRSQSIISLIIGLGANLVLLYFSFFITRAPNLYFHFFLGISFFVIIFCGREIYSAFSSQQPLTLRIILDLLSIGLVIVFVPLTMKHRRYSSDVKKGLANPVI